MANQVEILNLDINTSALISKMTETRAEIDKLQAAQKSLQNSNQTNSDAFTKNAVAIGRLQTSYNTQKTVVAQLTTANNSFATATNAITSAIGLENTSIASARENNKQLLALRNQMNLSTAEGQTALTNINAKLDQNNAFIKENVSAYEKQKIGIGDYKSAITGAIAETGLFGGQIQSVKQALGSFTPLLTTMKNEAGAGATQIRNSAQATEGMTTAQKALAVATNVGTGAMRIFTVALAATGIGLIIAAVALLIGYFKTFDPLVDKLEQVFAGFGAAVMVVQRTLGEFLTGITSIGDAFTKLGNFIAHPIDSLKKLGDEMGKAANEAANLKAAQQDLADQQSIQEVSNAKALQQYNELILKSKNRTLSEEERIAALKKAEAIETTNFNQRTELANKDLKQAIEAARIKGGLLEQEIKNLERYGTAYATKLVNAGKITQEEVDLIKKAELNKIAIQDESTKRLEKNQNAQDKLAEDQQAKREKAEQDAKEAAQKRAEAQAKAIDLAIQKNKQEIDLYVASQGIKKKSMEAELAFEQTLLTKKLALLKQEYDTKKITELQYQSDSIKLKDEFAKKQVDIAVANAAKELEDYKRTNQQKRDDDVFFTEQKLQQRILENTLLGEEEIRYQAVRLEQGVINQQTYNDAIDLINENTRIKNEEAQILRDEAKKEQQAIDLENQRILDEEKFTNEFDLQIARENLRYQAEVAAAEKTGASVDLITQKHAQVQKNIELQKESAKRSMYVQTLGEIASLLGEQTAAGKAAAIAQATMSVYQGVTNVWSAQSVLPEPIATIAKVVSTGVVLASGLAAVKKITSTKTPSYADGGIVPTLSSGIINTPSNLSKPLSNGDNQLAFVGTGEVILNKEQQALAGGSSFFRSLGVPGFAGGGFVGGNTNIGSQRGQKIDVELMANMMANANRSLPAPVVSVTEISNMNNRVGVYESAANF